MLSNYYSIYMLTTHYLLAK